MPRARVVPPRGRKKSGVREFFGAEASPSGARKRSGRHRHAVRHQRAVAKPGPPHIVRIGTDIFLRRGKCPRRHRAQYVGTRHERSERSGAREGISVWRGGGALLSAAARCDPDTLSWRPKCSSQAHYAAAAPRPARISSGGMPGKTGRPRPWRGCCPVPAGPAAGGRHPCARSPPPPQHLVVLSHWNKNLSKNDKKHL